MFLKGRFLTHLILLGACVSVTQSWRAHAQAVETSSYFIVAEAWTCQGRGAIRDMEAGAGNPLPDEHFQKEAKTAECIPAFNRSPVNVIAFQGPFAFICNRLTDGLGMSFNCTYALTADLRDARGQKVPDHFSALTPSPHFFDRSH